MTENEVRIFLNGVCDLITTNLNQIEKTRYDITFKSDDTPVTKSDIFIEELVHNYVRKKIPNVVFIGEESFNNETVLTDGYVVLLDPIDGTENFCSGMKEWGVSFGLWKGDSFLGSFLLLPELGVKLLSGDKVEPIQSRITGLSSSISDSVRNIMNEPGEYRIMGCAVYNLYNVIRGSYCRFINPEGAYAWDLLPGIMLALEQGCRVILDGEAYNGEFLDPKNKYIVDIQR
ncbi:inositol monophosphatase family protein [Sporosarcina sp. SAFN-015]|uniref:inositol monophosphatase family protein n=1 Tax=Sporosarcina sp. SAFN-015 TaxID=3387274 RepID=UPI003F7E4C99